MTVSAQAPFSADQQFLDDLDKKLWNAADRLRSNLDAALVECMLALPGQLFINSRVEKAPDA